MARRNREYDPHLLYHTINITVELEYKVPMQKVYDLLYLLEEKNQGTADKIQPTEVLELLKLMSGELADTVGDEDPEDKNDLPSKIKELLRLLGCYLTKEELNAILRGEVPLDKALSPKAKAAWLIIFDRDEMGKFRPNKEVVNELVWLTEKIAYETIENQIQRNLEGYKSRARKELENEGILLKNENIKTIHRKDEYTDPRILEQKRINLKLYIAHMQGYDRDRDRDGGLGIDMSTGEIIDFGDIYIADKEHGAVLEDRDHDGIIEREEIL